MAYATIEDIELRTGKTYTESEKVQIAALLCDAGVLIDSYNANATARSEEHTSELQSR